MSIKKELFVKLLKTASFKELFNELGWDNISIVLPISIEGEEEKYCLSAVSEKRGFVIFLCTSEISGKIPTSLIRKQIDKKISKLFFEHLIIYADNTRSQQIWQLVIREPNKPIIIREAEFFQHQHPESLIQKLDGLFISLDEEDKITIADIRSNVREQFNTNAEKVTKKFYIEFKAEHTAFLKFIKGIEDKIHKEWYASLMLNRLMFLYFIQKKGFLDGDRNYLSNKLNYIQEKKGKNKFYSFYKDFLLVLFHEGLGKPHDNQTLIKEIGRVPYLNGGLFDLHQIERDYSEIAIEDKAFEKIFEFFDQWNWHLDTKITATGKDINPDVIGYIFEKYINDRASTGAYYTKEDITEYISKNTIIPFLFEEVKKDCRNAFKEESSLWKMLSDNPDRYIYTSVKHGIRDRETGKIKPIPKEIENGISIIEPKLIERRATWNDQAPPEYALPTEIWREVIDRRERYKSIYKKLENNEIHDINDFITYNLDIRQFVQDAITNYEGSDFINSFYKAIKKVTILDPTCGSGAFLFAALNILEPLYFQCIERMKEFVSEDDGKGGKRHHNFRDILKEIKNHPNQNYYIYKSIILNNLYGVDIMNEAVEIAKLRLFLKLVAEVDKFEHIEPLPDIDFNIRCGNTLVGFATKNDVDRALTWSMNFDVDAKMIYDQIEKVSKADTRYKEIQLQEKNTNADFRNSKDLLKTNLGSLNLKLNEFLGHDYGKHRSKEKDYYKWLENYKPFHWFAEYYNILKKGGFDIVIGNPPYVEYSLNSSSYVIKENIFNTYSSKNLYAYCFERGKSLTHLNSRIGFIVQISSISTPNMKTMVNEINTGVVNNWISNYATRPSYLFDGVTMNLTIILSEIDAKCKKDQNNTFTTKYNRWNAECREFLFQNINYVKLVHKLLFNEFSFPKLTSNLENKILEKVINVKRRINSYLSPYPTKEMLFYRTAGGRYFKLFLDNAFASESKSNKEKYFLPQYNIDVIISVLSSNLWWWFYTLHYDMYNCKDYMIFNFPFDYEKCKSLKKLQILGRKLNDSLLENAETKKQDYSSTGMRVQKIFKPSLSKYIMDKIDLLLAEEYNLSEEELDFIINYDIKFRISKVIDLDE